jgi:hypothetical protein
MRCLPLPLLMVAADRTPVNVNEEQLNSRASHFTKKDCQLSPANYYHSTCYGSFQMKPVVTLVESLSILLRYPAVFRVWEVISFQPIRQSYSDLKLRFGCL